MAYAMRAMAARACVCEAEDVQFTLIQFSLLQIVRCDIETEKNVENECARFDLS